MVIRLIGVTGCEQTGTGGWSGWISTKTTWRELFHKVSGISYSLSGCYYQGRSRKSRTRSSDTYPGKENEAKNSFSGAIPYIGEITKLQII